ncbi:hypothetical protein AUP68_10456 [Ilyonectria robusta]
MVNKGRPSKDCLPCRKRKLRCDLKLESCGQCQRAKIVCHGYRNLQDLVFRDETDAAKNKVLARPGQYPAEASGFLLPMWGINLDMDTRCRETFFSLYVTGFSRSCTSLVPLYTQAPVIGHLACSVDAVSLAFMAVQFESQEVMSLANTRYVEAIQNLGQALRDLKALVPKSAAPLRFSVPYISPSLPLQQHFPPSTQHSALLSYSPQGHRSPTSIISIK